MVFLLFWPPSLLYQAQDICSQDHLFERPRAAAEVRCSHRMSIYTYSDIFGRCMDMINEAECFTGDGAAPSLGSELVLSEFGSEPRFEPELLRT